jgi:glycosyltransferase involved in cell wall biosynthesis
MSKVYVYDPTASDSLSRVRGIGRYLQLLKENFSNEFEFIDFSKPVSLKDSIFINPFVNFLTPPIMMRKLAARQIAVIHDLIPLKYGSYFPAGIRGNMNIFFNKVALKNYDIIVTDSEASKKDILRILNVSQDKVKVIYPCLPKSFTDSVKSDEQLPDLPNKFCVYVGDATWNKNLINIAKAVKIVNATCLFVGKIFGEKNVSHSWQKELKGFLTEVKDDKRFVFPGFITDSLLLKIYQQASVNILVSRDEGFGFSWLEAAVNSCPSLLSNIEVLKEISGGAALFADPENPNDIADKIGEIYFRRDQRNRIGRQAFKRSQFFNSEKFRRGFEELL